MSDVSNKLEIGDGLIFQDDEKKDHEFTVEGSITITFEGEKEKTFYIAVEDSKAEKIEYVVTDEDGNIEPDEKRAETIVDEFLEAIENDETTSESEEKK